MAVFDGFADQNDYSVSMLHNLFGVWIDNWDGASAQANNLLLPHLFRDFSLGIFSLVMIFLFWGFLAGTVNTARDGSFLGRDWDSAWIPIRIVVGTFFSVPMISGYNTIQYLVFKIVFSSILLANFLWTNVNYQIYSSGTVPVANYQNNQKLATDIAQMSIGKFIFNNMLGDSTDKKSGMTINYNSQMDGILSSNSMQLCGVGDSSQDCKAALNQLGQDGNYSYSSIYNYNSDNPDKSTLGVIKLTDLKVDFKMIPNGQDNTPTSTGIFADVDQLETDLASQLYGQSDSDSSKDLSNCKVDFNGTKVSCGNLIGSHSSIADQIVDSLSSGSSDDAGKGSLYCPSRKIDGKPGQVDEATDCKYFSWWHANWHYAEIDHKLAQNSKKVLDLISKLDQQVNGFSDQRFSAVISSASGVFLSYSASAGMEPTTPIDGFPNQVNLALKDKPVSNFEFSSGVMSDGFNSAQFTQAFKDSASGITDTDTDKQTVLNLLYGLDADIAGGEVGKLKYFYSTYFSYNYSKIGTSDQGSSNTLNLFGKGAAINKNYFRIKASLLFLQQNGMLLPAKYKGDGDGGDSGDTPLPQNYVPKANPMYYVKNSGLLGSIFKGLLTNNAPLYKTVQEKGTPDNQQGLPNISPGSKNSWEGLYTETESGTTQCNDQSCSELTKGILGQIYQIGLLETSSGSEGYGNLVGEHFSMIQQVQAVGVHIISGVLNIMNGVYSDFMDKYKKIIEQAHTGSTEVQTQYLEFGWSGIGQAFAQAKAVNVQFGIMLVLAQISQSLMWLPLLLFILTSLFSTGIMFAIIIPLTPYILFWAGKVAWLLLVLEALAAAPVVVCIMIHPDGHKIWGHAEQAVKMLLNVFLMPPLLIIGLVCGIVLTYVVVHFSALGFHYIAQEILGMAITTSYSGGTGLTTAGLLSVFMIMMYAFFITMAFNKCFSTIYVIPEKVLTWIGIQGTKFGEQDMQEMKSSGQQLSKDGMQSGGQSMQQGIQGGEKIAQSSSDRDFKSAEAYGGISRGAKQDMGEIGQGIKGSKGQ